jgi:DNA-binding MarR family transcriptional regulator
LLLIGPAMHALFFSAKRVHHRILAFGRRYFFKPLRLTPARFDMLYAIKGHRYGLTQRELRDILGVTAATVSVMATSLEALGHIKRKPCAGDARNVWVKVTKRGRRLVNKAIRLHVGSGAVDMIVDCAFSVKWYSDSRFEELYALDSALGYARRYLRDEATLHYYFHPDD